MGAALCERDGLTARRYLLHEAPQMSPRLLHTHETIHTNLPVNLSLSLQLSDYRAAPCKPVAAELRRRAARTSAPFRPRTHGLLRSLTDNHGQPKLAPDQPEQPTAAGQTDLGIWTSNPRVGGSSPSGRAIYTALRASTIDTTPDLTSSA